VITIHDARLYYIRWLLYRQKIYALNLIFFLWAVSKKAAHKNALKIVI